MIRFANILLVNPDPTDAAKELVVAANAAGGEDNTSVIVVAALVRGSVRARSNRSDQRTAA